MSRGPLDLRFPQRPVDNYESYAQGVALEF